MHIKEKGKRSSCVRVHMLIGYFNFTLVQIQTYTYTRACCERRATRAKVRSEKTNEESDTRAAQGEERGYRCTRGLPEDIEFS